MEINFRKKCKIRKEIQVLFFFDFFLTWKVNDEIQSGKGSD